ncbi:MAG TPA: phospholipid carrier-dependent glycosyltransferase [Oscillatoriales cyanobacterium M59_W2019_021]|nr:phospholipid carrier-dependent glycosyltransferase [Oscillatoriales cyanobacterium M4454_W2019_049]HIK51596.1 phospholipid carrier-dependent glycosyltransferase [Oscillatoriales cyanobacterium M59_W2019_021]
MKPRSDNGKLPRFQSLQILAAIWLVGAILDRLWFAIDRSVPSWDSADYLIGAMNYWRVLQSPEWLSPDWWDGLWRLSSKIPPLTYIATAPFLEVFGTGFDAATCVNLLFSAILLLSVYGLGKHLFDRRVGLWAALLCALIPGLYRVRLEFLLDYPLVTAVTLAFFCLTVWRDRSLPQADFTWKHTLKSWLWAIAFGISLGLALMVKQTVLLFLWVPLLWVTGEILSRLAWGRLLQLVFALLVSVPIWGGWYRANWLLILTSGKRATIDSAMAEGDPPLNSIAAWTYYWEQLPEQVSLPLLMIPIAGFLVYIFTKAWIRRKSVGAKHLGDNSQLNPEIDNPNASPFPEDLQSDNISGFADFYNPNASEDWQGENSPANPFPANPEIDTPNPSPPDNLEMRPPRFPEFNARSFLWLAVFWVGAYLLSSLNVNKDFRYVLPYLPVLAIALAWGLLQWGALVRTLTAIVAVILCMINIFAIEFVPLPVGLRSPHSAYLGAPFPHTQIIDEIVKTEPYLRSTLGVLPSTPEVNQHNFSFYGSLANFQVYGRQVGVRDDQVTQDARSLSWFLTKTGEQGSVPESQAQMVQTVTASPEFEQHETWSLPDRSQLQLYHRKAPLVTVTPLKDSGGEGVRLDRAIVPGRVPPGYPVPLTYVWSGNWEALRSGLVLLTWKQSLQSQAIPPASDSFVKTEGEQVTQWLHDRAFGMGTLVDPASQPVPERAIVTEATAMLPPANAAPGIYTLEATYLNRETGETYPIPMLATSLTIDPKAAPLPAQELDFVTQLREFAKTLPEGVPALETVFAEIARINQYDPIQDYLEQAALTLEYRLQQEPQNVEWAYAVGLARVVQKRVGDALSAFDRVVELDGQNPNAHAYLAFLNLCDFRPGAAQREVETIAALDPNFPELPILRGATALMRGNLFQAARDARTVLSH